MKDAVKTENTVLHDRFAQYNTIESARCHSQKQQNETTDLYLIDRKCFVKRGGRRNMNLWKVRRGKPLESSGGTLMSLGGKFGLWGAHTRPAQTNMAFLPTHKRSMFKAEVGTWNMPEPGGGADVTRPGEERSSQGRLERALGLIGRIGAAGDHCSGKRGLALPRVVRPTSLLLHASGV